MAKKCGMEPATIKGISLIVIGVLIYLNDKNAWMNWAQFVALIAVLMGLLKIWMGKKR